NRLSNLSGRKTAGDANCILLQRCLFALFEIRESFIKKQDRENIRLIQLRITGKSYRRLFCSALDHGTDQIVAGPILRYDVEGRVNLLTSAELAPSPGQGGAPALKA